MWTEQFEGKQSATDVRWETKLEGAYSLGMIRSSLSFWKKAHNLKKQAAENLFLSFSSCVGSVADSVWLIIDVDLNREGTDKDLGLRRGFQW